MSTDIKEQSFSDVFILAWKAKRGEGETLEEMASLIEVLY